jgi:hypothetical protein
MAPEAKTRHTARLSDARLAKQLWPEQVSKILVKQLLGLVERHHLSVLSGDIQLLNGK